MAEPQKPDKKQNVGAEKREELYDDQVQFFARGQADGKSVQKALGRARVLLLGAGAIGSHAADSLAASGVGQLQLLDPGQATPEDTRVSALLDAQDAGRPRADALAAHVARRNQHVQVSVKSADLTSAEQVRGLLGGVDCVVVCLDSPAPHLLHVVNQAVLRANRRLIVGQVYQGVGVIGPTVIPHQSPCYQCYELRRLANLPNYEEVMQYETRLRELPGIRSEVVAPRPLVAVLGRLVALDVFRLLTGTPPQTVNHILRVDFFAPSMTYHRVLRLPNCPACGYHESRGLPQNVADRVTHG